MGPEDIPFGIRRYRLAIGLFLLGGAGFIGWSRWVDAPMFVFPFGQLDAPDARLVLILVGMFSMLYGAALSYLRLVKRPVVALREDAISIPVGEFAQGKVILRVGDVLSVREDGPRAGGWRTCHVRHRGGELAVRSSQLPSDEAFFKICERLRAFVKEG